MDELDKLKKYWQKNDSNFQKLSKNDLYPMLWKKSSSIVKWLFYISIAELIFWILINVLPLFFSDPFTKNMDEVFGNGSLMEILTIFSFAIILLFIYLLFKSYKTISVTDNAKKLMESILKTRKIIKYYVIYNLIMAGISLVIGAFFAINNDPKIADITAQNGTKALTIFIVGMIIVAIAFLLFIWLFYKLIYGILLRRLNRNYKALQNMDG